MGWGTPQPGMGYPPGPGMGYPPRPGIGSPFPQTWDGVPPPRQVSIANTCYAAGGMPLAFTQEDFLVTHMLIFKGSSTKIIPFLVSAKWTWLGELNDTQLCAKEILIYSSLIAVRCQRINLPNGYDVLLQGSSLFNAGSVVSLRCNWGFSISGPTTATCQNINNIGTWTQLPTCNRSKYRKNY